MIATAVHPRSRRSTLNLATVTVVLPDFLVGVGRRGTFREPGKPEYSSQPVRPDRETFIRPVGKINVYTQVPLVLFPWRKNDGAGGPRSW